MIYSVLFISLILPLLNIKTQQHANKVISLHLLYYRYNKAIRWQSTHIKREIQNGQTSHFSLQRYILNKYSLFKCKQLMIHLPP